MDAQPWTPNGGEVCREIRKKAPALPVIVLSAKTDVTDKVLLLELGADDYLTQRSLECSCGAVLEKLRHHPCAPSLGRSRSLEADHGSTSSLLSSQNPRFH